MTPPAKGTSSKVTKKTTKKVTKKTTKKATKATGKLTSAQLAKAAIMDQTGQKPLRASFSTLPHVPTGAILVDDAIGGTVAQDGKGAVCPGYPRRRITEVYGPEGSGKTTLGLQAVAEVQKQGGTAMFLDFEHAIHHGYAKAIGVNFHEDKLLLYAPNTMEQGFQNIYIAIMSGVDLIVVDSVAAMVTQAELDRKIEEEDLVGAQARKMSSLLKRLVNWLSRPEATKRNPKGTAVIFINQTRSNIKSKTGEDTTPGGKALKFYSSLRLKVTRTRSDVLERKDPLTGKTKKFPFGNHTEVKVVKNKMDSRQGYTADIFIRYGFGIDDFYSVIEAGVNARLIKKGKGSWYIYKDEKWQGREKFRAYLKEHPDVFKSIRDGIVASVAAGIQEMIVNDEELDEVTSLNVSVRAEFGDDHDDGEAAEEEETVVSPEDVGEFEPDEESALEEDDEDAEEDDEDAEEDAEEDEGAPAGEEEAESDGESVTDD